MRNHQYPGYYLHKDKGENRETNPVEFINDTWYDLTFRPYDGSFWVDLEHDAIGRHEEGTGYWYITDPQHSDYTPPSPSPTPGPSQLTLPRERTISVDTTVSPLRFAVLEENSDSDSDIQVPQILYLLHIPQ